MPSWSHILVSALAATVSLPSFTFAQPAKGNGQTLVIGDTSFQPEEYSKFFETLKSMFFLAQGSQFITMNIN